MKFYGELLIFILLLLTNLRVFIIKKARYESLVILGPLSLLLSIFQIFSWGIDIYTVLALLLSFIVTLSNFHALIRLRLHLYIDHFSPLMKFWAVFTTFFSILMLGFTIFFAPVNIDAKDLAVTETKLIYQGSFQSGFTEATNFSSKDMTIYEYTLFPDFTERKNVALFVPDKRGDTFNYEPYLKYLSKEGITVCSADFFSSDSKWFYNFRDSKLLRRTCMIIQSINNNQRFMSQREFYTFNTKKELDVLLPILQERYGKECNFFLIGDVMTDTAIEDFYQLHKDVIAGTFYLDSIEEYNTAGFGCVELTEPFIATLLGSKRDKDGFITKYLVLKSKQEILQAWLKK